MKVLYWIGGILLVSLLLIYTLIFTPPGNTLLKPIIELQIKQQVPLDVKLKTFSLGISSLDIVLQLTDNNSLNVKGEYSLFSQKVDIAYAVNFKALEELKKVTNAPLRGGLHTNGTLKGELDLLQVDGVTDLGRGQSDYHVTLTKFQPTKILAALHDLQLDSLLYMAGEKKYVSADVNLDVDFKNINPHALDGVVALQTQNGKLNSKLLKDDFNLSVIKTDFNMDMNAELKGDDIHYNYMLDSNIMQVRTDGLVVPEPLHADLTYDLRIKELALLKSLSGADLRGAFKVSGDVRGDKENMVVHAMSDLAASNTKIEAQLQEFKPKSVHVDIKSLNLAKLLYMVKQPHYTDGYFNMQADIANADVKELAGTVNVQIEKGLLDSKYLTKTYAFKSMMPKTSYTLDTKTNIADNIANTKIALNSTLADLDVRSAKFNLKDNSIKSDYKVMVPSLDKLFFVTQKHMRNGITLNGEMKKGEDIDFTAHSHVADGDVDAKLHNDDFTANLEGVQTLDVLNMMIYPEIFKSKLYGKLDYNLKEQKGALQADLKEGKFTHNKVLDMIKKYVQVDMYVEKFNGDVHADINKENILASCDLKSNTSAIKTKNTKLNSKTKQIDSKITVVANKQPISVTLKGDVNSPKVGVDLKEFMKSKAGKELKDKAVKEVDKLIKSKEVNKFLKGLF